MPPILFTMSQISVLSPELLFRNWFYSMFTKGHQQAAASNKNRWKVS